MAVAGLRVGSRAAVVKSVATVSFHFLLCTFAFVALSQTPAALAVAVPTRNCLQKAGFAGDCPEGCAHGRRLGGQWEASSAQSLVIDHSVSRPAVAETNFRRGRDHATSNIDVQSGRFTR